MFLYMFLVLSRLYYTFYYMMIIVSRGIRIGEFCSRDGFGLFSPPLYQRTRGGSGLYHRRSVDKMTDAHDALLDVMIP